MSPGVPSKFDALHVGPLGRRLALAWLREDIVHPSRPLGSKDLHEVVVHGLAVRVGLPSRLGNAGFSKIRVASADGGGASWAHA